MARQFLTRDQDDDDDLIAAQIAGRESELAGYDLNISSLNLQLEGIAPENTEERNKIQARITAETAQRSIAERAYQSMLTLLPAGGRRTAAMNRRNP